MEAKILFSVSNSSSKMKVVSDGLQDETAHC
jgi:hypothetical protein